MAPQAFACHSRRVRLRDVGTVEGAGLREAEWGSVAVGCRPRGSDSGPALHPWVGTSGGTSSSGSRLGCRCFPGSGRQEGALRFMQKEFAVLLSARLRLLWLINDCSTREETPGGDGSKEGNAHLSLLTPKLAILQSLHTSVMLSA